MRRRLSLALLAFLLLPLALASTRTGPKKTVAVLRYDNNTSKSKYDNLGRALSAMMISDLSAIEQIQLVEREKLSELLAELELQESGYVDPATAQTVGAMVGAEYVVAGAFFEAEPEMRLDARIVEVETSEIVKTAQVSGPSNDLIDLQEKLAEEFVDGLAITLSGEDRARLQARQEATGIRSLETAMAFSTVLCLVDHGAYVDALAEIVDLHDSTPGSALVDATLQMVRRRAEEEAKDRLKDEANELIGGLFGRKKAEPERPPRPEDC